MNKKYKIITVMSVLSGLILGYSSFYNGFGWNLDPPYEILNFLANAFYWSLVLFLIISLFQALFLKIKPSIKKFSKGFKITMSIILLPVGLFVLATVLVGLIKLLDITSYNKYEQKSFQAYEERYQYCGMFWGGTDQTREEIYQLWKKNEIIGC